MALRASIFCPLAHRLVPFPASACSRMSSEPLVRSTAFYRGSDALHMLLRHRWSVVSPLCDGALLDKRGIQCLRGTIVRGAVDCDV